MEQVLTTDRPLPAAIPGIRHATWAGSAQGLTQLSIWRQTLAPGAMTPPHSHDCDEVVICEAGEGELLADGRRLRFGAGQVVVLPKERLHQLVAVGSAPLELLTAFGGTPVGTRLPDGQAVDLPWST